MYPNIPKPQENINIKSIYDSHNMNLKLTQKNVLFKQSVPVEWNSWIVIGRVVGTLANSGHK